MLRFFAVVPVILLSLAIRPVSADFAAAETADRRGDLAAAYQACKADAEAGDARCQNYLGVISERGRGVPRDPEAALGWFRRAATSGFAPAQLNLAAALDHGRLMPHDPLPAYIWYSIAARLASDPALRDKAARGRDRLAQKIDDPEIEAARAAARSWTPGSPDPTTGVGTPRRSASRPRAGERLSSGGSGFIMNPNGDVLTNYHVVDGCRELHVLHDGEPVVATLVAADPTTDLAILRLPLPIADAALVRGNNPGQTG